MLRSGIKLFRSLRKPQILSMYQVNQKSFYAFSQNEPPKGFEKFKRKEKVSSDQVPDSQTRGEETEDKVAQTIKNIKKDEEEYKDKQSNKVNDENPKKQQQEEIQESDKKPPQTKKFTFNYDPKIFGFNRKDESKSEKNDDEDGKENKDNKKKQKDSPPNFNFSKINWQDPEFQKKLLAFAILSGLGLTYAFIDLTETITFTDFVRNYLDHDKVHKISIHRDGSNHKIIALIHLIGGQKQVKLILGNVDHFLESLEKAQLAKGKSPDQFIPVEFKINIDTNKLLDRIVNLIYLGVSITLAFILFKSVRSQMGSMKGGGGDIFGFGKSNVKQFGFEQSVKVKFKDVAGLDEAKNEIKEFVDFLKRPRKYKDIGAKIPRGALLAGPPGTGKTMLAKACAGEAGVPFYYVSGSDFVEMFVGVGASRVRDLFKQAKQKSPGIIFIDEIDAVGRKREARIGGNDERDNTLNQLLVEMDGFGTDTNIVVLAATNRKELLDPALTRPGRFDRTIDITLPDIEGRKQIFMVHLKPLKLDPSKSMDEYAKRLSTLTPGFSGAEIANLCNEAAILAARGNKLEVTAMDFELAAERVMAGLEKKRIISEEERKIVAYHESGHAVVSWFLEGGHPLLKLTIIPRSKGSLGYAQYLPNESNLETKEELLDRICCILGGRCSEQVFFGRITTGAYDDLKKAYETAHAIVTKFGMSENIGYVGFQESEFQKPYSDSTNKLIDDEIKLIIDQCSQKTLELIKNHRNDIDNLAKNLLEKETLDLQKIVDILGERPFAPKSNYKAFLDLKKLEKQEQEQESKQKDSQEQNKEDQTQKQESS